MPRVHVVFGAYSGPIPAQPGERVLFIGDCANWRGQLGDELVSVDSLYRDRTTKDPHEATHEDVYAKLYRVKTLLWETRHAPYTRLTGCPVSVAEQVLALQTVGGTKNPFLSPSDGVAFNKGYLAWKASVAGKRLVGQPYQVNGPTPCRGAAAPHPNGAAAPHPNDEA